MEGCAKEKVIIIDVHQPFQHRLGVFRDRSAKVLPILLSSGGTVQMSLTI